MNQKLIVVVALACLALPTAALAKPKPPADPSSAACKAQLAAVGSADFKSLYGNMGQCVAKMKRASGAERGSTLNAAKQCKAERGTTEASREAFRQKYGTNANKANAFGKCVSAKAREATEEETDDRVNAAQTCKALRTEDKAQFEADYGTKKNAFGKCVSATAKADHDA